MKSIIAERIKQLRIESNLTQTELADKCMVKQSCISKWERGSTLPDAEMLIALCKIFDVPADYLLGISEF